MRLLCPLACLAACTFSSPHAPVDAEVDGGGGDWVVIETFKVPANGGTVLSAASLQAGVGYRLRASGTYPTGLDTEGDAEYFDFTPLSRLKDSESGVDVGVAVNDSTVDAARMPRWGSYNAAHVYEVDWTGDGNRITAQLHDGNYVFNSGELTLEILARQ